MEVSGRVAEENQERAAEELQKFCEPCLDEHVTTCHNGMCYECMEFMCNTCFRHHLKARQCRNHVLVTDPASVSLRQDNEYVEKCKYHENEKIKYFCRMHETVGCGDCMIPEHSACQPEYIKDFANNFQENKEFGNLIKKLEHMTSANKGNTKSVQDNTRANEAMQETTLKDIRNFRTDINRYLDKAEAGLISELYRLKSENETLLAKLKKECKQLSSKIEEVKQKLDTQVYQGNALFIQSFECRPEIRNIENAVSRIQFENNMKKFQFVPDQQLLNIIFTSEMLGSLDVPVFINRKYTSEQRINYSAEQASRTAKQGFKTKNDTCV